MQIGRGDSRNFSSQYGAQPPVDYTKNTVGMDDLRRLTNKGSANRQSSSQMSFGPTSLFSSRSNSRKAGPSGSQSRTGEDSGASSRTGTPPQQKEKVSSSVNAFRYVALSVTVRTLRLIILQPSRRFRFWRSRNPGLTSFSVQLSRTTQGDPCSRREVRGQEGE